MDKIATIIKGNDDKYAISRIDNDGNQIIEPHPYYLLIEQGYSNYVTHWNGGRIYGVYFKENSKDNIDVLVYRRPRNGLNYESPDTKNLDEYWDFEKYLHIDFLVKFNNIRKVFVPIGEDCYDHNQTYPGNSLLFQFHNGKYLHIGSEVYEFEITDEIIEYYSVVENNDVPQPIAIGTEHIYVLFNKTHFDRNDFPSDQDWLNVSYDDIDHGDNFKFKIIHYDELPLSGIDKEIMAI
jgi:hypothetical protein